MSQQQNIPKHDPRTVARDTTTVAAEAAEAPASTDEIPTHASPGDDEGDETPSHPAADQTPDDRGGDDDSESHEPEFTVVDWRFWAREDEDDVGDASTEDEAPPPRKPTYVEELEKRLKEQQDKLSDTLDRHRAAVAEFENARARLQREVGKEVETHKRRILSELLEILDNLERAIDAGHGDADKESLLSGVSLVRDQFLNTFREFGVQRLTSKGEAFDPARHEAVSTVPVTDEAQNDTVVGVIKECYLIGDDTLRPAMVAVGRLAER